MKNQTKSQSRYSVHKHHGPHQWNIKYYDFESEYEIESAVFAFFGEYDHKTGSFEMINELLGRVVRASISGRSGGWFVIDEPELSDSDFQMIDQHISSAMDSLPEFLKEEREYRAQEQRDAEEQESQLRASLETNPEVTAVLETLRRVAGSDFQLSIKGIKLF